MKSKWCLWIVISLSPLLLLCDCGEDGDGVKVTPEQLTEQGWTKFEAGSFGDASADFEAAIGLDAEYAPAYLGLGWAELRRSRAGLAEDAFLTYLSKVSGSSDATAGLALACDAQDKFEHAIDYAENLLSSDPQWSFGHDPNTNYLDVALVLAGSYYLNADYTQSLAIVQQYFDPSFNPDLNTDEGRTALGEKIEELYTG